jgi:hypothetical protein
VKKILLTLGFLLLSFNITSAHLGGWSASLKANIDAPGIFSASSDGTAVVSPMRDIQLVASITGDSAGAIKYSFLCDKAGNTPITGTVKLSTPNQTAFIDLVCKFPGEGEFAPNITFAGPDGDVSAAIAVVSTFNPTKGQFPQSVIPSTGRSFDHVGIDFILGILVAVLAMMIYKLAPARGPMMPKPPVGWTGS